MNLVCRYVRDAHQAYRVCSTRFGISGQPSDLWALLRAARKGQLDKRGEVAAEGVAYEYRIHGAGYSFKEVGSGKLIHFDVVTVHGSDHVRFSVWELHQYGSSVGELITEAEVASELKKLSDTEPRLVHVQDGPFDYYYLCSVDP